MPLVRYPLCPCRGHRDGPGAYPPGGVGPVFPARGHYGGEPFLQWDAGLSGLHEALISQGIEVQYETSGKIRIPIIEDALVVCSPKHIAGAWRFDEENVRAVHVFKFTADGTAKGFEAIDGFIAEHGLDAEKVCIMPLGATRREQLSTMEPVFAYCLEKGYRMSPRLQVLTFDTRRGI